MAESTRPPRGPDQGQRQGQCSPEVDGARTTWLEAQGFRVLRFWNNEGLENRDGVLAAIRAAVKSRAPSD